MPSSCGGEDGMARAARGATGASCWSRYSSTARRSQRATGTPERSRMRASRCASTFGTSQRYCRLTSFPQLVTTPTRPDQIGERSEPTGGRARGDRRKASKTAPAAERSLGHHRGTDRVRCRAFLGARSGAPAMVEIAPAHIPAARGRRRFLSRTCRRPRPIRYRSPPSSTPGATIPRPGRCWLGHPESRWPYPSRCRPHAAPRSSAPSRIRRGALTKAGNTHARRALVEAAWHYRHRPTVGETLARRSQGQPGPIVSQAWHAQQRLHRRYRHLVGHGKRPPVAVAAVARELVGFIWATMTGRASRSQVA
jgi:hypothetical protein